MKNLKKYLTSLLVVTSLFTFSCKKTESETDPTPVDAEKLLFSYLFSGNYRDSGPKGFHIDSANSTGSSFIADRNSVANNAVNLSGSGADKITLTSSSKWKVSFPFTISMWVYVTDKSDPDNRFFESDGITANQYYGFWIHTTGSNGQVAFNFSDGNGNSRNSAISSMTLNNSTWHHIAAVYKGVNNIEVYLDGTRDNGATYDSSCDPIQYSETNGHIGAFNSLSSALDGGLDNVKMWGRALSSDEILNEYNSAE